MRTSDHLTIGKVYSRAHLREMFNITDATINTGIFQPSGHDAVWLFVTENKTPDRTQYEDKLEGDILEWDGQTFGRKDDLIIRHSERGLEVLLFFRREKYEFPDAGFRYEGPFEYVSHEGSNPTHFRLRRARLRDLDEQDFQMQVAETATAFLEREEAERRGQGFLSSPDHRRAVEHHAMETAKCYLEGHDFEVEDTSAVKPYDLVARKPDVEVFVEVKGTTTAGEQVVLTNNEVEHARVHRDQSMLFILYDIQVVDGPDGPAASGGTRRVLWPWDVNAGVLVPISYRYQPP